MVSQTNEQALEALIEKALTGHCLEEIKANEVREANSVCEESVVYGTSKHFTMGLADGFDAEFAMDTRLFWQFLEATQADELDKLRRNNAVDWKRKILERFDRLIKKQGLIGVRV